MHDAIPDYSQQDKKRSNWQGRRLFMSLSICRHLGMDCSFNVTGTTDNEIMRRFLEHAESAHNMNVLTADVIYRVQKALQK
ncbi:MAG: DUF1059 domain-containing protein [Methanoregula sp.]|nr:DUF1059 domain-containing protein [Methanoregula sp.]